MGSGDLVEAGDRAGLDRRGHVVAGADDAALGAVLGVFRQVEPGDVGPADGAGDPGELVLAGEALVPLHLLPHPADDRQAGLAVADHEEVDVGGQQLGVLGAGAAGDDEGVDGAAVLGLERDAAQVEHRQQVRVADLVLEREAHDVELGQGRERLQPVEGDLVLAQGFFEVGQGGEGPLAGPALGVHEAVEDLEPVVAHAQGIGVGEGQAERPLRLAVVLQDAIQLAAGVLAGGRHIGQDAGGDVLLQGRIQHARDSTGGRPVPLTRAAGGANPDLTRPSPDWIARRVPIGPEGMADASDSLATRNSRGRSSVAVMRGCPDPPMVPDRRTDRPGPAAPTRRGDDDGEAGVGAEGAVRGGGGGLDLAGVFPAGGQAYREFGAGRPGHRRPGEGRRPEGGVRPGEDVFL